jgi:spermidine/putrescine ABC transporter ATP-binding subunit
MSNFDVELLSVSKSFGAVCVVKDIDLQIPKGEFVSILGPSGCGKTTTLNMMAGFSQPSAGDIRIRGRSQVNIPPERRNIGLVFQNYALFPHMTVAENVAFGLKMKAMPKADIAPIVRAALQSVHLETLAERYPKSLSGGQQQRVALARALAPRPSVLLLDEPLSNLDLKLREVMRAELKDLQQELGMTFVYVTHDQEEAMAMSDRIVVMCKGAIAQQGDPSAIYQDPASTFVADFIGRSNILPIANAAKSRAGTDIVLAGSGITLRAAQECHGDNARYCVVRPEDIVLLPGTSPALEGLNVLSGTLRRIINLGASLEAHVEFGPHAFMTVLVHSAQFGSLPALGEAASFGIAPQSLKLLSD